MTGEKMKSGAKLRHINVIPKEHFGLVMMRYVMPTGLERHFSVQLPGRFMLCDDMTEVVDLIRHIADKIEQDVIDNYNREPEGGDDR